MNPFKRVIKNTIYTIFFLVLLWFVPATAAGQAGVKLPAGLQLSFNGRFVQQLPDGFRQISENGRYKTVYTIGHVGDEVRELLDFGLYEDDQSRYRMDVLPGSDVLVSNDGHIAVFDMQQHFNQEVRLLLFDPQGKLIFEKTYRYASLFGFSPQSSFFGIGTGNGFHLIATADGTETTLDPCSRFAFSRDESLLATAREGEVKLYTDMVYSGSFQTGFFYPRALAVNDDGTKVSVVDKHELVTFSSQTRQTLFTHKTDKQLAYRDLVYVQDHLLAGMHQKKTGVSKGILQQIDSGGRLLEAEVKAEKTFAYVEEAVPIEKGRGDYDPIPWPFMPFDEMHTVWNYYEQHMGNNWNTWSYLHQGLDIITPIDEPTYAVQAGYVKCVLTLGGDAYWRVAISPEQTADYSDGWLYAHLVPGSIQVEVGDYVELHDYLGDIIYWSDDWGHIHFVEIRDHGLIWYYDDDEWGINFNPLLALTPNTDTIAPVIEDVFSFSMLGFLEHGTSSNFLHPNELYGDIDIIAKITDFHADSPWELPAYETFYEIRRESTGEVVVPRTLGRRLNHAYPYYSVAFYEDYAPLIYHKNNFHLPPSWMSHSRNYYQVLTRNNGDSLIDLSEQYLSFATTDFPDGYYEITIEAWDEVGNMNTASQVVYFDNNIASVNRSDDMTYSATAYPNPAADEINIRYYVQANVRDTRLELFTPGMELLLSKQLMPAKAGWNQLQIDLGALSPGMYFFRFSHRPEQLHKFVIAR